MLQKKRNTKKPNLEKEWFIFIENQPEGPYNLIDLKQDHRFTPDTLVWKKGFAEWIPARFIAELQDVFKDESTHEAANEPDKNNDRINSDLGQQDQLTLILHEDPHQFFLWVLILLIMVFYTLYQFYK